MAKFWDGLQKATTVKKEDKLLVGSFADGKTRYADVNAITLEVTARLNELDNRVDCKSDVGYRTISTKQELFMFQQPGLYGVDIRIDEDSPVGGWGSIYIAPVGDDGSDILQLAFMNGLFYQRVIPKSDSYLAQYDESWTSVTADIMDKMEKDKREIILRLNQKVSSNYYLISSKEDLFLMQNAGLYGVEIDITGRKEINGVGSMFVSFCGDNAAHIMQMIFFEDGRLLQRVIPDSSIYQAQYDSEWTEVNENGAPVQPDCFSLQYAENGKSYGQFASFCFGEDDHIYIAMGNYSGSQGGIAKLDKNMNLVKMYTTYSYISIEYCYGKIFAIDPSSRSFAIFSKELELISTINTGIVDGQRMFRVIGGELYYLSKLANEWNLQKIDAQGARITILNYGATQPSDFRELYGSIYVCVDTKIEVYNLAWEKQTEILNVGIQSKMGSENNVVKCLSSATVANSLIAFSEGNLIEIVDNAIKIKVNIANQLGYNVTYKDSILYGAMITVNQYLLITGYGFMIYACLHPFARTLASCGYTHLAPVSAIRDCKMKDGFLYYSFGRKLIKHQIA